MEPTASISTSSPAAPAVQGRIAKTAGYYWAFIALGLTSAMLGPTLPGLAENTRTTLSQVSILFTARSLGYLLGPYAAGRLYDRLRGHPLMAGALAVMAAIVALVPFSAELWLLALLLLVLGMAEGLLDLGGNILIVWVHREKNAPFMNGLHFFFGVGAFLCPIVIAQAVLLGGGLSWGFWALALLLIPAALYLVFQPSPAHAYTAETEAAGQEHTLLLALLAVFFFLNVGAEASFGGWIYSYALELGLADETTAAYLTSAFWGALMLGRLLTIPIAARLKPQTIILGELIGCLLAPALILLWPASRAVVWAGTILAGLSMASVFPSSVSFAERRMAMTGKATRWIIVGGAAGGMVLPWVIGQLFERFSPYATMWVILIDLVFAFGIYLVLVRAKEH
jgi:fucose permease